MEHLEFTTYVQDNRRTTDVSVPSILGHLGNALTKWKFEAFGNLHKCKRRMLARLRGIQQKLDMGHNDFISNFEVALVEEYNLNLYQEEIM